ncbi:peptidase associated/transthyretin-like domain-containing protein [Mariniflexile maritimum]|uniref:hypothetical protein n=1 Tax=Mariniflexile maritimum TaxID=2682493 RepID=UPI0012F62614|nr:hypothetical protein [Mariniflexile maritimum]
MKSFKQILIFFIYLLLLNGCSSIKEELIPTYNKGGYKMKIVKSNIKASYLKISGKVSDVMNNKPLDNVYLSIGCNKIKNSQNGEYSILIKNDFKDNYLFVEVVSIGYKTIQTKFINITNESEIKIDFYLTEDDRPLINCEGIN